MRCALKHERDVLHDNVLVAVCYADGRGVVDQPVLQLHGAGLFGRVLWEGEPFGEGLIADLGAETGWAQRIFLFKRQGSVEAIDTVASIILSDSLSAAKAVAECRVRDRRRSGVSRSTRRGRRQVASLLYCTRATVLVPPDGEARPTADGSRLIALSSAGAASWRPGGRPMVSAWGRHVVSPG